MLEAVNPGAYFFNVFALPTLVVGTVILATGVFVLVQHRQAVSNQFFFLVCLAISLWLYGISFVYAARRPELALAWYRWVAFLGVAYLSPLIYGFSVHWLGLYERQKKFLPWVFGLATISYLGSVLTPYGMPSVRHYFWGYYPVYGPLGQIFLILFFGSFWGAFYNFFSSLRRETDSLRRKQIQLIATAFLISLTGSVDYLPKLAPLGLYPFGYLPVLAWILIVAYLIVRYRVMDIQTVIHKTIMWALTSVLFAAPVILFSYLGKQRLVALSPIAFSAIVFSLVVLFTLYARFVQPLIDHIFQRRRWDLNRVFEEFTDELVHLKELTDLTSHVMETVKQVFYVQEISIFLSRDEESELVCVQGLPPGRAERFDRDNTFLDWLEKNDRLVRREFLDLDPRYEPVRETAKAYFRQVDATLCLPLVVSGQLLGIVNLGPKANLKSFDTAEINFLSDLRKAAAIALSNTLRSIAMQESLRRWNAELEKKVEERTRELKETQVQLIQAEKLATIGTLAGGVAHEINNPLTAVLTNVQMLKMSDPVEDPESLALIEEGARRCQQIIQKLMRYARKTDEAESYQEVDLNRVIQSVCDFIGYQLKQDNITVELALGSIDPVLGISNELEQVFTNLILNAKDAIKLSGRPGRIGIRTKPANGQIQIEVADNGIGIKKESLARIFDPFYTTKDVGEGTGLGLTVSSGIVEKHRGRISVTSNEGQGTVFLIQLPVARPKLQAVNP